MGKILEFRPRETKEPRQEGPSENRKSSLDTGLENLFERKKALLKHLKTMAEELGTIHDVLRDNVIAGDASQWKTNVMAIHKEVLEFLKADLRAHIDGLGESDPDRTRLNFLIVKIEFAQSMLSTDLKQSRVVLIAIKQLKAFIEKS